VTRGDDDAETGDTISEWLVKDGPVSEGDNLLELTTDKAAFVLPTPKIGTLLERKVQEGDRVDVGVSWHQGCFATGRKTRLLADADAYRFASIHRQLTTFSTKSRGR
jgi:hypothetical protein